MAPDRLHRRAGAHIGATLSVVLGVITFGSMLPSAAGAASSQSVTGKIVAADGAITIETSGKQSGTIAEMMSYADKLADKNYPYIYGGGHAHAGQPSNGGKGKKVGYDCSGTVGAILAASGLWPKNGAIPGDAGIISDLEARHMLSAGVGDGPDSVTLWDDPNVHIYMAIGGALNDSGQWRQGIPPSRSAYRAYHIRSSFLKSGSGDARYATVQVKSSSSGELITDGASAGIDATVTYTDDNGTLLLSSISYPGATTVSGVISDLPTNGKSVDVTKADGTTLKLDTPPWPYGGSVWSGIPPVYPPTLIDGLDIGDAVSVTYTTSKSYPSGRVLHAIRVTAQPRVETVTGTIKSENSAKTSLTLQKRNGQTVTAIVLLFSNSIFAHPGNSTTTAAAKLNLDGLPLVGSTATIRYLAAPDGFADTLQTISGLTTSSGAKYTTSWHFSGSR